MYGLLKKRPLRAAIRDHTSSEKQRVAAWLEILKLSCELVGFKRSAIPAFLRDQDLHEKEVVDLSINVLSHYPGTFAQQLFLLNCLKCEEELFHEERQKKVLLITGVQERESRRRMAIMKPLSQEGQTIWLAPFFDWDGSDVQAYMDSAGIPSSPVYPFLHRSGECNWGAFAVKGELGELLLWYPDVGKRLQALEERARQNGFSWGWEQGPPRSYRLQKQGQMPLWDAENQEADIPSYLCSSCEYFHEGRTAREGQQREEAESVKEGGRA